MTASSSPRLASTSGNTEGGVPKVTWVSPATTDCIAGLPPLNGTCTISTCASLEKSTADKCGAEPLPEEA